MSKSAITNRHRLHPRYWPLWSLFGLGWLVAKLPYPWQLKLGAALGKLIQLVSKTRRHVTQRNIEICFPQLSAGEQQQRINDSFKALGMGFIEIGLAYWGSAEKIAPLTHLSGLEHIASAQAEGKGVLLVAAHMTSLELCLRMFSEAHPAAAMYKQAHNDLFENYSYAKRARYVKPIANKNLRPFLKHMRQGGVAFYLPDQHYGSKHSVFAPFFGVATSTIARTPEFIKLTGAAVIPVLFGREKDGYHIRVQPAIAYPSGDPVTDATTLNQWMERNIEQYPEQYLWQHRRFKQRPKGEPKIY